MQFTLDAEDRIVEHDAELVSFVRPARAEAKVSASLVGMPFASLWPNRVLEVCGPVPARARTHGRAQTFFILTRDETRNYRLEAKALGDGRVAVSVVDLARAGETGQGDPRFAILVENVTDLVMVLDPSYRLLAFNALFAASAEGITGRPLHLGEPIDDVFDPLTVPRLREHVARALAGEALLSDLVLTLRGGYRRTYEISLNPVRDAGVVTAVVGIGRNVTERRAEAEARRAILEASPDAIIVMRRDGTVTDYYPSSEVPIPLTRAQIIGHSLEDFSHYDIPDAHEKLAHTFQTRETQVIEHDVRVDGEVRRRESRLRAISDDEAIFIVRDVTQARQLMSRLVTTDRMAALGTMAAGIGHELNNPLAFVSANLELVATHLGDSRPALKQAVTVAQEGVSRMAAIVRDLGAFARTEDDRAVVDVGVAIDFALRMVASTLSSVTRVERLGDLDARVCISESRLGQVLVNLLVNAAQAFDPERDPRQNLVRITVTREASDVVLSVADNGLGMAEATARRVFDPFFTTKPPGVGTGLGLWVVQGIVRGVGGEIDVESVLGEGTTMRVRLPGSFDPPSLGRIGTRARRLRLLLVDDDPMVLDSLSQMLELLHDVTAVGSADSAREVLARGFDLVLCDLTMPGETGLELLEALAREAHPARRILMTGAPIDDRLRARLKKIGAPALPKPFKLSDLDALL